MPLLSSVLIALAVVSAGLGLWLAWRRRAVGVLLYATGLFAGAAIFAIGNPWNGGKALATVAPIVLLLATAGAAVGSTARG